MDFTIRENKLKQIIFNFLDESELSMTSESEPWADGGIPFYDYTTSDDTNDDGFEPEIAFVYYEYPDDYSFMNTYDDDMFPLVEILEPYCTKMTSVFTEDIFFRYSREWFENELKRKIKTVSCG